MSEPNRDDDLRAFVRVLTGRPDTDLGSEGGWVRYLVREHLRLVREACEIAWDGGAEAGIEFERGGENVSGFRLDEFYKGNPYRQCKP